MAKRPTATHGGELPRRRRPTGIKAFFALPMTPEELVCFQEHTGRVRSLDAPARKAWLIIGRRGGKSRMAALIAVFLACFRDYRDFLAPGERGVVMVIAADRHQAGVVFRYIAGLIPGVPMLSALVERRTDEALHLTNRIIIEVHTASFRAVRSYTVVAAVCDEIAFWRDETSANPDTEVRNPPNLWGLCVAASREDFLRPIRLEAR